LKCSCCGKELLIGERYLPAYENCLWIVEERIKPDHLERKLIKTDCICWECVKDMSTVR